MNISYLATAFHWDLCNMFLWIFPATERIDTGPNWYQSSVAWSQVFQLCFWCHFVTGCHSLCTKQSFILLQEPTVHFQHVSSVCAHDSSSAPQLNSTRQVSFVIAWLLSFVQPHISCDQGEQINQFSPSMEQRRGKSHSILMQPDWTPTVWLQQSFGWDSCRGECVHVHSWGIVEQTKQKWPSEGTFACTSLCTCAPQNNMWDACQKGSWILVKEGGNKRALRRPPFNVLNHVFFFISSSRSQPIGVVWVLA